MIGNITEEAIIDSNGSVNSADFQLALADCIKTIDESGNADSLQIYIVNDFLKCLDMFQQVGDLFDAEFQKSENPNAVVDIYCFNYIFPEDLKQLVILHRDVLLQLIKSSVLANDKKLSDAIVAKHFSESRNILKLASSSFLLKVEKRHIPLLGVKNSEKRIAEKLTLSSSPWNVYSSQLNTLKQQISQIAETKEELKLIEANFLAIGRIVGDIGQRNMKFAGNISEGLKTISKSLLTQDNVKNQIQAIDRALTDINVLGNDQRSFTSELHEQFLSLKNRVIPISTAGGVLQLREISMQRAAQKWFDFQILPDYMELVAIETEIKAKYRLALMNLKNGIQLSKTTKKVASHDINSKTLQKLGEEFDIQFKLGAKLSEKINMKVSEEFKISRLFKEVSFLEVPINAALSSSLNVSKLNIYKAVLAHIKKIHIFFNKRYERSTYLESFSDIEIATNCIAHRMFKDENEHYDILFLTKNFIGDLFLVPRVHQEEKLREAITQWNKGFNKSVLVHGDRLSGRSTFMEYTTAKYFGKHIVNLAPNSDATIDGRKFTTTCDLGEALDYVKKNNSKSTRSVILIDNLELWRDDDHSLLDNTRDLIHFIENESDDALVIVSTTNVMQDHLDGRVGFSKVFSTAIDVTKTEISEIVNALLLRHEAANRRLVSEQGEAISLSKIRQYLLKISKKYHFNLGEVLQAWTYNTNVKSSEEVLFKLDEHEFLDFFSEEELLILKQAALYKTISEVGLKRLTATGFDLVFRSAIKRLVNTKVLVRDVKGNLYINPVISHDINQLLKSKVFKTT